MAMLKPHWIELIETRRQTHAVRVADDAQPRLQPLSDIRAVVFDVYGTLFSSGVGDISLATESNRDAELKATLQDNGITLSAAAQDMRLDQRLHSVIHRQQAQRRAQGIVHPEVDIRKVWAALIDALLAEHIVQFAVPPNIATLAIDYESRVNPTQPMPDLARELSQLHKRGLILSIISNAQFYTPLLFDAFLLKDMGAWGFCPDCSVWSYAELEGKPSPHLYQIAAQRLWQHYQLKPQQVLYVGNDMRNDICPAQSVGFKTALFAGDRLSLRRRAQDPECAAARADLEITELAQIGGCV